MMTVRCYLAPSAIEGLGVFAAEPIARGDIVWRFDPEFDRAIERGAIEDASEQTREFMERYTYDHPTDPDYVILDADEGRFMNHSGTPNLDFSYPDRGVARCDIAADEELTCDYNAFNDGPVVFQPPRHRVTSAHPNGAGM